MQKITLSKSFKTNGLSKVVVCSLTTGPDEYAPGAGAEGLAHTITARVVQNVNGEQTNTLATGDMLTGGTTAGDVLNATVQAASPLNATPQQAITPILRSIETTNFTALDVTFNALGGETVGLNAINWFGTDKIASIDSDASLVVYNVNTLGAADARGDVGAQTGTMTVRMAFTGNNGQGAGKASDMTVLFDEDYIIGGSLSSPSSATFYILDQDGALQGGTSTPLMHTVDAAGQVAPTGTITAFTATAGISFSIDGVAYSVSLTAAQVAAAEAATSYTFANFVSDLNTSATGLPAGVTITLDETNLRTTFLDDGSAFSVPGILVTSANGGAFTGLGFVASTSSAVEFNEFGRFTSVDPSTSGFTEVNVELLKAGRDGDGGNLIIGGMEDGGIEIFNVSVEGRADQPSSLASLASTNNKLETVNVTSATGSLASLEIGNSETSVANVNGMASPYVGVTTSKNNALVDVKTFNAVEFDNGVTVHASVTDASVAKYMVRTDTAADSSADNADFAYTSGDGNDTININISKANLAASGTANREDFSMAVSTGAGDDLIQMQIGDGAGTAADAWYVNHGLMDANADSRIGVDAGAGNDTVHTNGSTIFRIDLGAGNDAGYTDNSGASKAAWILNDSNNDVLLTSSIDDIVSDANDSYALFQQTVNVTYKGYTVSQVITDYALTDLEMNNIIKGLIAGDEHLSDLIAAADGPGNTLVISSLIDGVHAAGDFAVSLTANTAVSTMSDAVLTAFNAANSIVDTTPTQAEAQTAINNALAAWNNEADYNSQLAQTGATTAAAQTVTIGAVSTVAGTTTVVIGGLSVAVAVGAADTVATQLTNMVNAINAATDLVSAAATGTGELTITAQGAAVGLDIAAITVTTTATGPTFVVAETADGSTGVTTQTGANSTAENGNTITDGTGNDTIVLSTDATSSETVVLVSDGVLDMVVNFTTGALATGGDVLDFVGTWGAVSQNTVGAGAIAATAAANGEILIVDFADLVGMAAATTFDNLTVAEFLLGLNGSDATAAGTVAVPTSNLILVKDGSSNEMKVFTATDNDADADWESATLIDSVELLGADNATLVAVNII